MAPQGDASARQVEAAERSGGPGPAACSPPDEAASSVAEAQRQLVLDLQHKECAALDDEVPDLAVERRPDDGDVGDRRVGEPGLGAVEAKAPLFSARLVIECLGWVALTRLSIHHIRRLSSAS
jgi:hypothetical protein